MARVERSAAGLPSPHAVERAVERDLAWVTLGAGAASSARRWTRMANAVSDPARAARRPYFEDVLRQGRSPWTAG